MRRGELRSNAGHLSTLLEMHGAGRTNVAIARSLGCTPGAVRAFLGSKGLSSNPRIYRSAEMVGNDHVRCSKCRQVKHIGEWSKKYKGDGSFKLTYCQDCYDSQQFAAVNKDMAKQFLRKMHGIRFRCRRDGVHCDLTVEHLLTLWREQSGLCFYTDVALLTGYGNGRSQDRGASIDRIHPDGAYTAGNVVIASVRANSIKRDMTLEEMKAWMPGWYLRVERLIKEENNE